MMVFWEGYVSDEAMGTFAPIVVYWLYAGFYQVLPPLDSYRLHTRKEEEEKNLVPLWSVVKGVLLQQIVQAIVAHGLFLRKQWAEQKCNPWEITGSTQLVAVCRGSESESSVREQRAVSGVRICYGALRAQRAKRVVLFDPENERLSRKLAEGKYGSDGVVEEDEVLLDSWYRQRPLVEVTSQASSSEVTVQPSLPIQIVQIVIAMLVMDTWQYFVHRYMHQNKFLYRHVHSQHHRLVVPYAIGALYNHPLEGLLLDTFGGALSFLVSGMTARTAVIFFCFAVIKTVDDHCGLWLPGNIFHLFFQNNTAYHDIHHQLQGTKYNYSQPFFPIWDKLLGTHMPYRLLKRAEGGFEARLVKD
ncbi:sphingoid base hydroxylase 2 [Actinidia rufa]|uniref:Sphingoid base hydroxylase 2 n=1 Tax=Actinidia rufa TaxID=165716 RepID=A0A7J0E0S6_9ERIC|nr:sphingoid base hydroxylase 2 [Actinidia rufa]